jgi:hypothetical protein
MKSIIALIAKLAVVAAVGYALYAVSKLNQRTATEWTGSSNSTVGMSKSASRERSASLPSEERRATGEPGCVEQTWPNIAPECIGGRDDPAGRDLALIAARAQTSAGKSEAIDPTQTGSLPGVIKSPPDKKIGARKASRATREARRRTASRTHRYATRSSRAVQWAARPRRAVIYAERYRRRTAYAPWEAPDPWASRWPY